MFTKAKIEIYNIDLEDIITVSDGSSTSTTPGLDDAPYTDEF